MEGLFLSAAVTSAAVSAVLLPLLLLLPRWGKRYAPQTRRAVWLAVALVLLIAPFVPKDWAPVQLTAPRGSVTLPAAVSRESVSATVPGTLQQIAQGTVQGSTQGGVQDSADAGTQEDTPAPQRQTPARQFAWLALVSAVWLAGAGGVLLVQGGLYLLARRSLLEKARSVSGWEELAGQLCPGRKVRFFQVEGLESPLTLGLFRPVVILPAAGAPEAAVAHELFHVRRWDVGYKALLALTCALHWYNPLVWLMSRRAGRDVEASCDSLVAARGDRAYRRAYGELLLQTAQERPVPFTTRFGGGKELMKARLYDLFHPGKKSRWLVLAVLCFCLLAGCLVACESGKASGEKLELEDGTYYGLYQAQSQTGTESDYRSAQFIVLTGMMIEDGELNPDYWLGNGSLTFSEELTLKGDGASYTVGEPGSENWKKQVSTFLMWPTLRSTYLPGVTEFLELEVRDGLVVSMERLAMSNALYRNDVDGFYLQFPEDWAYDYTVSLAYSATRTGGAAMSTKEYRFSARAADGTQRTVLSLLINDLEDWEQYADALAVEGAFEVYRTDKTVYRLCPAAQDDYYLSGSDPDFNGMLDEAARSCADWFHCTGTQTERAVFESRYYPFVLQLPESWTGYYRVEETADGTVEFFCTADSRYDVTLGTLKVYEQGRSPDTVRERLLGSGAGYSVCLYQPTNSASRKLDKLDPGARERYNQMYADLEALMGDALTWLDDEVRVHPITGQAQPQPDGSAADPGSAFALTLPGEVHDPGGAGMEPDRVSADTMGAVLVDETLSGGTRVVCYWEPGSEYTKYWAVRTGDELLRFCEEYSAYGGLYGVEEFTNVLGRDGFRISAPRGAAYHAYDYYVLDDQGVPRLLAGCANQVLEPDLDGDGTRELVWFYHGTDECYYLYPVDGTLHQAELTAMLRQARPEWASVTIRNDGCSPGAGQLTFTYEADGAFHTSTLTVQEGMLYVSASAG